MKRVLIILLALTIVACHKDFVEDQFVDAPLSRGGYQAIHVSPNGEDSNDGLSYETPLLTLNEAVAKCDAAGYNSILMLGGTHRQELILDSYKRSETLTIEPYPNEKVTISGLERITTDWSIYSGNIYVTEPNIRPWQLFEGGEMVNAARFPNVDGYIEDSQPLGTLGAVNEGSILDRGRWIESDYGTYDGDEDFNGSTVAGKECVIRGVTDGYAKLSDLPFSVAGAVAMLNIASYKSYYTSVDSHVAGSDEFTYYTLDDWEWRKPQNAAFYLEGKLEFLDKEGEWFYDIATNKLYLYCKDGGNPNNKVIEGKTQSYAIFMTTVRNIVFSGIDFIGTTFYGKSCQSIYFKSCNFTYPSASKRMLREDEEGLATNGYNWIGVSSLYSSCHYNTIENCTFRYSDGEALAIQGNSNIIRNNIFENIDIACVNMRSLMGSIVLLGTGNYFQNNDFSVGAPSATLIIGTGAVVEGNNMHSTGYLEGDGSVIQIQQAQAPYTIVRNNWIHDTDRYAIRVDSPGDIKGDGFTDPAGSNTTMTTFVDNVLWNCNGIMVKGDYHLVANNTLFTTYDTSNESPCSITILVGDGSSGTANTNTMTYNNLADLITGWYRDADKWNLYELPEQTYNNYVCYYTNNKIITDFIQDVDNYDFRPLYSDIVVGQGADLDSLVTEDAGNLDNTHVNEDEGDIGAVEYNTSNYVVAGAQKAISSSPLPADGATTNSGSLMLAWLPAYESTSSKLYMGTSANDLRLIVSTESGCYYTDKSSYPLSERASTIYWRVDCVVNEKDVTGDVWSFNLD